MGRKKENPLALLPILVFLVLYLGLGITFEYVLGVEMGFYNIPIVVVFMVALLWALLQNCSLSLNEKFTLVGQGMGQRDIVIMILIFLMAGLFVGVVGRSCAESVAYFMLSIIPPRFAVSVLFIVSCFISTAMGTSVGTITLIAPIGLAVAASSGFDPALCTAAVMGGAMFGDNLSFISDTTIAACNGQGCDMRDKFRENFRIAVPAALATLCILLVYSFMAELPKQVVGDYNLIQTIPYLLVLVGGAMGVNVFAVLLAGIVTGSLIMLATGATAPTLLLQNMGKGVSGMFETIMVAVLVAGLCALIRENGGFEALLSWIKRRFKGQRSGQLGMGLLVGFMDIATANNTVAIVMANPIAREIAASYGIPARKAASILDTFSCIFQGILPYGAQMLVALSAAASLGYHLSAFHVLGYLFYPAMLLLSSLAFIVVEGKENNGAASA